MSDIIHHTVYKTKNLINEKFYIGIHSTDDLDDDYLGSGIVLKKAIEKYGKENFEKVVLFDFVNKEDAIGMEKLLVDKLMINQPDCYNARSGGLGGSDKGSKISRQAKENIRQGMLGRVFSEEHKRKIGLAHKGKKGLAGKNNPMFGLKGGDHPAYGYKYTSEQRKNRSKQQSGKNNSFYGKKHSTKTRRKVGKKISKKLQGMTKPEGHKQKISLSKRMFFAEKRGDFELIGNLQELYKVLDGEYHPRYLSYV